MEDKDKNKNNVAPKQDEESARQKVLRRTHNISYEYKKPKEDWPEEVMGRDGLEPTRYGDWEIDGKCTDF